MITFEIRYIAMVAADDQDTGARIAFPRADHTLQIKRANGSFIASGKRISLEVWEGATERNLKTPNFPGAGKRIRGRVVSIKELTGEDRTLNSDGNLLAAGGPAQAVLHVHGGAFSPRDPHTQSRHRDADWDLGGGKTKRLTDTVVWTLPYLKKYQYFLNVDGAKTALAQGEHLLFANTDAPFKEFRNNGQDQVEMTDVTHLYALLDQMPASRPIPVADWVPPPFPAPQPSHKPDTVVVQGKKDDGGGDLPLCPVGEP